MLYCIAMAVGVVLGAGCVCLGRLTIESGKLKVEDAEVPEKDGRDSSALPQNDAEREKLQKQWENFLNYGGSAEGQVQIES